MSCVASRVRNAMQCYVQNPSGGWSAHPAARLPRGSRSDTPVSTLRSRVLCSTVDVTFARDGTEWALRAGHGRKQTKCAHTVSAARGLGARLPRKVADRGARSPCYAQPASEASAIGPHCARRFVISSSVITYFGICRLVHGSLVLLPFFHPFSTSPRGEGSPLPRGEGSPLPRRRLLQLADLAQRDRPWSVASSNVGSRQKLVLQRSSTPCCRDTYLKYVSLR